MMADDDIAGSQDGEVNLGLLAAVPDRIEQLRVGASEAGQQSRVDAVALALVAIDKRHLARVSDDHLVPHLCEGEAHPGRVGPGFEGDTATLTATKRSPETICRHRHSPFLRLSTTAVDPNKPARLVRQVQANEPRPRTAPKAAILLHAGFLPAPRARLFGPLYVAREEPAFSSHLRR